MQPAVALPSAVVTPQLQQEQQRAPQTSIRAGGGGFEAALRHQTQAGQRVGFAGLPSLVQTPPQQQAAQFAQQPAFIPAQQQPSVASQGLLPQFNAAAAGADRPFFRGDADSAAAAVCATGAEAAAQRSVYATAATSRWSRKLRGRERRRWRR